ncbi:MAG: ATP-binding protein [Verrucomicrobiales bacterium]|nr:ATP-binding protein [Verrucomicrobiales bacterium]MCP5525727.1 ATP-binding protein [Verrucomicrobiales bacterium]
MNIYRHRELRHLLRQTLRQTPVTVISGLRQAGKSTFLQNEPEVAAGRAYATLDDLDALESARAEPDRFLGRADKFALDEAQRLPELFLPLKRVVDQNRLPGRFVLTGSANLLLLKRVADSLAGRAFYAVMHPLNRRELLGRLEEPPVLAHFFTTGKWPEVQVPSLDEVEVLRGGFPEVALNPEVNRQLWFDGFERSYLERDVRDLRRVEDLASFRRLLRLCALRVGNVLNASGLARDVKLSEATVRRHLDLLETLMVIHRLPPFLGNRSSRLIKSPKLYFADSGLAAHLAGVTELAASPLEPLRGALLENFVLQNLMAALEPHLIGVRFHFWHEQGRQEVDFVVEHGRRVIAIEVKAKGRVESGDTKGLQDFVQRTPDCLAGVLTYSGRELLPLGERLWAVPLHMLLG